VPESAGKLYIVATPIGNLDDLSPRAREILATVDAVLCEDTRHTGQMLARLGIDTRRISFHEHNEEARVAGILEKLAAGQSFALVSDAGTPLISDPGYRLLAAARESDLPVSPVPGPCAAIAGLSVAGLPTDRFCFEGFLPSRAAARRRRLEALAEEARTLVFYESGRRLADTLDDMIGAFGIERAATLARELTKTFESVYRGSLGALRERIGVDADLRRGESVLVIAGTGESERAAAPGLEQLLRLLVTELPASRAARIASAITGCKRAEAFAIASRLSGGTPGKDAPV
jgi:16S rRNA (cytidine1402-2'-O)-methyltransferase